MINISPLPIFSDKWHIQMQRMPKIWSNIIEHTIIWTLSHERRLRDCELEMKIINITHENIINIGQIIDEHNAKMYTERYNAHQSQQYEHYNSDTRNAEYANDYRSDTRANDYMNEEPRVAQSIFHDPKQRYVVVRNLGHIERRGLNELGIIYVCSDNIEKNMQVATDATFVYLIKLFMDAALTLRNQKPSPGYKQKILSKFGLYGV